MLQWENFISGTHGDFRTKINSALGPLYKARIACVFDYIPSAQHHAIIAGTSDYDCHSDIMAAHDEIPLESYGALYFPVGRYLIGSTLELKRQIKLLGDGPGFNGAYGTTLAWPADTAGLAVNRSNTINGGVEDPSTGRADGASISGLALRGGGGTEGTAHGVWLRARGQIDNCSIATFAGNGINVVATAVTEGADREGNANNFRVYNCALVGNGKSGMFVDGADANAGVVIGVDASSNGEWGIYDSSFLGNTYVGCHTASNGGGAYKSDNANARNLFLGCYSESDNPPSDIRAPALVIGGIHAAGFAENSGGVLSMSTQGKMVMTDILADSVLADTFAFEVTDGTWRFKEFSSNDLRFDFNNLSSAKVFDISGSGTSFGTGGGRPNPVANAFYPYNFFVGVAPRRMTNATASPTTGEWGQGDIIFNSAPSAGGTLGWVCTTGGTAGLDAVFKTFGAISA